MTVAFPYVLVPLLPTTMQWPAGTDRLPGRLFSFLTASFAPTASPSNCLYDQPSPLLLPRIPRVLEARVAQSTEGPLPRPSTPGPLPLEAYKLGLPEMARDGAGPQHQTRMGLTVLSQLRSQRSGM